MKILVSGGAGFLGSHLCEALLKKGHQVICLDNLITGSQENIKDFLKNPNFSFIKHDIAQAFSKNLKSQISNLKSIYHLASPASPKDYFRYPLETLLTNSIGTLNLLELAKNERAKFLFASTSEVYGDPKEHPQKETYTGNVNPFSQRSCYDESKRFAESLIYTYINKYGLDARIVRIFNTYGPKMRIDDGRPMPTFINQAQEGKPLTIQGDGKQTRSFCYVSDMIEGIILAMEKLKAKGEVFNLGNPDERSIMEIARIIKKLINPKIKMVFVKRYPDDPQRRCPDISKAKRILGWQPKVGLEEGLKKTIKYFNILKY
jgi:dTDP-glucose 4,6-dehydratase/UDP-glucuronate decarboxylase